VILLTALRFWTLDRLAIRRCLLGTLGLPLEGILDVWCGVELGMGMGVSGMVELSIHKVFFIFAVQRKFGGVKIRRFRMRRWLLWLSAAVTTLPTFPRQTTSPPPANAISVLIVHSLYEIHIIYTFTTTAMSWAGFKKNVNRATTQVMMKTGHVEKTNDRDYEVEER
jgi:hypothetical protein